MEFIDPTVIAQRGLGLHPWGVFNGIDTDDMQALEAAGEWLECDGDLIIQDGYEQNYLYQVIEGAVEVFKYSPETKKKNVLAKLEAGACMGEIAFLRGDVASANVRAIKRALVWRIDHATLSQYVAEYPGGGQLCLNVADVLAQRVQEGNTRLLGVTQSLSAYFGHVARNVQQQEIEAPQAAGLADMEIPRDIYDDFVSEVLELSPEEYVNQECRDYVDLMIQNNEIDFIGWLETGQKGGKLKVILKFAKVDEKTGEIIREHSPDDVGVPQASVKKKVKSELDAGDLDSLLGETGKSESFGGSAELDLDEIEQLKQTPKREPTTHMVRVPQVQARIKAHTAVITEKPSILWRIVNIACWFLLPFVTAFTVVYFLPLDSKASIARNETYQKLPVIKPIMNIVMFQSNEYSYQSYLSDKEHMLYEFVIGKDTWGTFTLNLGTTLTDNAMLEVKLVNQSTLNEVYRKNISAESGTQFIELDDSILKPGSYLMTIKALKWDEASTAEAVITMKSRQ